MDLHQIESPAFVHSLSTKELESLASSIRDFLVQSVTKTGGPLASNLTTVELTLGIHKTFNSPFDKILFDASDLAYTHKILTGRAKDFARLHQLHGLSGTQSINESTHDPYTATKVGQALSIGYGYSMKNDADQIVVVLSYDSMDQGQVYEALNHISSSKKKMIIILNDTSTSRTLGTISTSLRNLGMVKPISQFRDDMSQFFDKGNVITGPIKRGLKNITTSLSKTVATSNIFTELGFRYVGPFDGHKMNDVLRVLNFAKNSEESVVVHFKTIKGKGYRLLHNEHKGLWVDLNKFDLETGKAKVDYPENVVEVNQLVFDELLYQAQQNQHLVLVDTIDRKSSEIEQLQQVFSNRYHHIKPNQHAFSFVSGLALSELKPVLLVESKFLLSGFKSLLIEMSLMKLPISMLIYDVGITDTEVSVQVGLFDLPLLAQLPHVIISQGREGREIIQLVSLASTYNDPFVLRIQNTTTTKIKRIDPQFNVGQWEHLNPELMDVKGIIITYGLSTNQYIDRVNSNYLPLWVINARFINPIDENLLHYCFKQNVPIFIVSEDYLCSSYQLNLYEFKKQHNYQSEIHIYAINKDFIPFGSIPSLKRDLEIDTNTILQRIIQVIGD